MIKLTKQQGAGNEILRIDGSLSADAVGELRRYLETEPGLSLTFNLDGLMALDPDGRALLILLRDRGHRLQGGSLYIRHLLGEGQS